jgi:hypothetical protein
MKLESLQQEAEFKIFTRLQKEGRIKLLLAFVLALIIGTIPRFETFSIGAAFLLFQAFYYLKNYNKVLVLEMRLMRKQMIILHMSSFFLVALSIYIAWQ